VRDIAIYLTTDPGFHGDALTISAVITQYVPLAIFVDGLEPGHARNGKSGAVVK
jgi:hypothetical protein